ncbi:MAG: hypothetical protein ACE14V_09690 [bacterium]
MATKTKHIWIISKKYSALFKGIIEHYRDNAYLVIDGKKYLSKEFDHVINTWCTKKYIKNTIDFKVIRSGKEILGFHDTPDETWAELTEEPFVKELVDAGLCKYRILPVKQSWLKKILL